MRFFCFMKKKFVEYAFYKIDINVKNRDKNQVGGSFLEVRARTWLKAKCIRNYIGKMLRTVIDLN